MPTESQRPEPTASPILIRADAGARIGAGHVMRCLALAQAWRDRGGSAAFATTGVPAEIARRLELEGVEPIPISGPAGAAADAAETARAAARLGAGWLVLDGYGFDPAYRVRVRGCGARILLLEDVPGDREGADVILNPGIRGDLEPPGSPGLPRLLLGPAYAPLRREFREWRGRPRPRSEPDRNLLVTMGGSDPDNVTLVVLKALREIRQPDLRVRVLVGPANPHRETLARDAALLGEWVWLEPPSGAMADLMAWADLAITAAGSTCWELAFMGVAMITVVLAENQRPIAQTVGAAGAAVAAGDRAALESGSLAPAIATALSSDSELARMGRNGRALVDGLGAERVAGQLHAVAASRSSVA